MEDATTENDLSANNEDLTVSAGDTIEQNADKKFGTYSRDFELNDANYLTHADGGSTEINGANQAISICAWYKPESSTSTQYLVAKYNVGTSNRQYAIGAATLVPRMLIDDDGAGATIALGATTMSTATWYHICGVYNDTDMRVYLNGTLDSNGANNPKTYSAGIFNGTATFNIGSASDPNNYSDGLVDDVCIFNRELSSAEVSDIYINGCQGTVAAARRVILIQ